MDSWLRTTEISGPTACSGPSGHGMYCVPTAPADSSEILSSNCSRIKCNSSFKRWE